MATEAGGFDALLSAFDRFYKTLDATTIPATGGGRTVGGIAHAVALSEATNALYGELGATYQRLIQQHGQSVAKFPPGVALMESDSPDGPWTPIPAGEIRMAAMGIGGHGADAMLLAALDSANKVAAFPIDKWNAMQAARPGANHQRFHAGEVVSAADLAVLESAAKLLRMKAPPATPTVSVSPELLEQAAARGAAKALESLGTPSGDGTARDLVAALGTLARNLTLDHHSLGGLVHELTDSRIQQGRNIQRMLKSPNRLLRDYLLKTACGSDGAVSFTGLNSLFHPPCGAALVERFTRFSQHAIETAREARNALARGEGDPLAAASGGTITADSVGADLIALDRILQAFTEALPKPVPLSRETPDRIVQLGERFRRAADLLRVRRERRESVAPDAKPPALPAGADESAGPALTVNQSRVLQTMTRFDASRLLSSKMIADEMDATVRLSEETVRQCVRKLIEWQLAERPEGDRSGARLNNAGRLLAGKIAD